MDVIQKGNRIKALIDYTGFKSSIVKLNYHLNGLIGDKTYLVQFSDIYNNTYQTWEDIYKDEEEALLGILNNEAIAIEAELWEKIVSDIYTQLYSIAYQKANKVAIEKITIAEIEINIRKYADK